MKLKLLVSPLAKSAYYAEYLKVAEAELLAHFPERNIAIEKQGSLAFLKLEAAEEELRQLARLSFVQGIFEETGDALTVVDQDPGFQHPEELVWGVKYRGKTNELVTQLAINLGLVYAGLNPHAIPQLLDPMAGRGTTMLWALRYGMDSFGIEIDGKAIDAFHAHVKKQCNLLKLEHELDQGQIGKKQRGGVGKFRLFHFGGRILNLTIGNSRDVETLLQKKKFQLLVADLPYGVQHRTMNRTRNPVAALEICAPAWFEAMRPGASLTLIFNTYQPKREELVRIFSAQGLEVQDFSAPHRMSESIVRDLIVFKKPKE